MMTEQEKQITREDWLTWHGIKLDDNGDIILDENGYPVEMEDPAPEGYITIH